MPADSYRLVRMLAQNLPSREYSKNTYSYTDEQTIAARRPQRRPPRRTRREKESTHVYRNHWRPRHRRIHHSIEGSDAAYLTSTPEMSSPTSNTAIPRRQRCMPHRIDLDQLQPGQFAPAAMGETLRRTNLGSLVG